MSDLSALFSAADKVERWKAEVANAGARLQLAMIERNCAHLVSQHEPVATLGLDRERLRLILAYIQHGDLDRLTKAIDTTVLPP